MQATKLRWIQTEVRPETPLLRTPVVLATLGRAPPSAVGGKLIPRLHVSQVLIKLVEVGVTDRLGKMTDLVDVIEAFEASRRRAP
jgi:hypothetical protein